MIEPVILGDCTLYCGDCLNADIESNSIDLTVTSPPYDNLRTYNDSLSAFKFEPIAQMLYRVMKPGGVVVWVVGDETINGSESGSSFRQALYFMELGFNLHDTMIYEKNGPAYPDSTRYHQVFEYMFVLGKGKINTINLLSDRKNRWAGETNFGTRSNRSANGTIGNSTLANKIIKDTGVRFNIWRINNGYGYSGKEDYIYDHPAIFPEQLAKDHILSWSNPGDIVFDPMMGSGTTGKMATKYQRKFIGCEVNDDYFDIAVKRIKEAQLQIRMEI